MASGVDTYFGRMKVISRNQAHAWFKKLSVDHYLTLIRKLDVSLTVHQYCPKTQNDGVNATLEIEAFLSLGNQTFSHSASTAASIDSSTNATFASRDDKMYKILKSRMDQKKLSIVCMDYCSTNTLRPRRLEKDRAYLTRHKPIKCSQAGHYAKGQAI